jgi:serine/threonine protein kinase
MCRKLKKCNGWISLNIAGIHIEGCIKDSDWLHAINIPCNQSATNSFVYIDLPERRLKCTKTVAHGSFGTIDYGYILENGIKTDVYIKKPILPGQSLLYEACIQHIVNESLNRIGFPTGASKILSIFALKDNSICFAMEPIENSVTLSEILEQSSKHTVSKIIIDCLLQVCSMIWYLETNLGINHRDLKPSNFLVQEHETEKKVIVIENDIMEIESNYSITFIDFGFSCIGSIKTHVADVSLSSVYRKDDPCPKNGRDMYLFIAFLYIEFFNKLPEDLLILFEKWLYIPKSDIISFLRKYGLKSKEWIYFLTGNPSITEFNCCPAKIVKDLQIFL